MSKPSTPVTLYLDLNSGLLLGACKRFWLDALLTSNNEISFPRVNALVAFCFTLY